jgi:hypothetical protein
MESLMREGIRRGVFHYHSKGVRRADFGDTKAGMPPLYLTKVDLAKKSVPEALQVRLCLLLFILYYFTNQTFIVMRPMQMFLVYNFQFTVSSSQFPLHSFQFTVSSSQFPVHRFQFTVST